MFQLGRTTFVIGLLAAGAITVSSHAQQSTEDAETGRHRPTCKAVRAEMVEDFATVGCKPPHTSCFLGEIDGNLGLRGRTHFKSDSGNTGPATSPGFSSYSGLFEYTTRRGTLVARETGVVNQTTGNPESGAVTAYQQVIEATGEFAGVTGHFFVSGRSLNQHVETDVTGTLCFPDRDDDHDHDRGRDPDQDRDRDGDRGRDRDRN